MCIGQIIFYEMLEFNNYFNSFATLLQAALGAWDMTPFYKGKKYICSDGTITAVNDCYSAKKLEHDAYLGQTFMLIFLVLNIVVILNLVIAILATTYNEYSEF